MLITEILKTRSRQICKFGLSYNLDEFRMAPSCGVRAVGTAPRTPRPGGASHV